MSKTLCAVLTLDKGMLVSDLLSKWVQQMFGSSIAVYADPNEISNQRLSSEDVVIVVSVQPVIDLPLRLRRLRTATAPLVLILPSDAHFSIRHLNDLRVMGLFSIETSLEQIGLGLKLVLQGKKYISHDFLDQFSQQRRGPQFKGLSQRELSLLAHIARGDENAAIADSLNISTKTVYSYKHRIYTKLGLKNDVQALLFALRSGLVDRCG